MSSSDTPFTDDPLFRETQAYPELFPVCFTHKEFPTSARVMGKAGTPFGCLVTPFMPSSDRSHISAKLRKNADNASKIARCDVCTGYLNAYCDVTAQRWFCSLCGARNSISRSQSRYRSTDPRLLPEVQHMMVDLQTAGQASPSKPFVHVLLVQESMPLDSLNAVVDGLSSAINSVHPDVYLVLITFSNRIGVYRLSAAGVMAQAPSAPGTSRQVSTESNAEKSGSKLFTPTPPPVQHIHFTYPKSKEAVDTLFDLSGVRQSLSARSGADTGCSVGAGRCVAAGRFDAAQLDDILGLGSASHDTAYGTVGERVAAGRSILEGRDPAVDFQSPEDGSHGPITPLLRIGEAINFWDACSRVGSCRSSFKNAVSSLFDACPSVSSQQLFPGESGDEDPAAAGPGMGALNMLGPAVDAVLDWLTAEPALRDSDNTSNVDCYQDGTGISHAAPEKTVMESLLGALTSFGLAAKKGPVVGQDGDSTASDSRAPSALVCGIMLHVLLASAPDLPQGLHESVADRPPGSQAARNRQLFNPEWVQQTAERASKHSICVNIWGVAPFAAQVVGLSELSPLASRTGGKTFRFLLGSTPVAERYRLSLQLARVLSAQYASKCVLKLRASQLVDLVDNGIMGHLTADPTLPGVYRMPCCSHDNTVASFLDYRAGAEGTSLAELEHLVVQVAFSYETLVEAEDDAPPFEVDQEDASQCIDMGEEEGYFTGATATASEQPPPPYYPPPPYPPPPDDPPSSSGGYASIPGNLLHPEDSGAISLSGGHQGGDSAPHSQLPAFSPPVNNRLGLPSNPYGEVENTPLANADSMSADEAYRRFSEVVCRVEADAVFLHQYREDLLALKDKNKSSKKSKSAGGDLALLFNESNLGFSHKKRLISVRRLRIITIAVDCVSKVPRLLSGTYPDVVAVMVAREVLFNVNIDSDDTVNGGVVKLIGGLYEWAKKLTKCAAKGYLTSKLARQFGARKNAGPTAEELKDLVKEAVDAASKDPITQASLYVLFGAMSRIIGGHSEAENALTIGVCIARYLGDSTHAHAAAAPPHESVVPARQKAHGSYSAPTGKRAAGPPTFSFSDSFAEVLSIVLTQDANIANRYLHPQLLPVRDDGPISRLSKPDKPGSAERADISSLVVEDRMIPPNRSGIAWSMMSDGSPMFILDAGDEIIIYRNNAHSGKKPFAGATSGDAPLAEHLVSNSKWLVNDINRRISISNYVPRFHYSRSGTASSSYLSNHLIDLSGDENSISYIVEDIKEKLQKEMLEEDDD